MVYVYFLIIVPYLTASGVYPKTTRRIDIVAFEIGNDVAFL